MRHRMIATSCLATIAALGVATAHAGACMVVGEKTARVVSPEGERSPVFLAADCASLRSRSGSAMVTWVSRDGKPNFAPIGPDGPARLPAPGAEERSGKTVWAELTTRREASRPAFMRALDEERPARIYVPEAGLVLPSRPGAALRLQRIDGDALRTLFEATDSSALRLGRDALEPGASYVLEWNQEGRLDRWRWQILDEAQTRQLDVAHAEIAATAPDPEQRRIIAAMLFDQLKLRVNMEFELAQRRAQ